MHVVLHALCNTLLATELGDTGLAPEPFKDDANLLLGRILSARRSADSNALLPTLAFSTFFFERGA